MERLNIGEALNTAKHVAGFVLDRLIGGGWSELPRPGEQAASITHIGAPLDEHEQLTLDDEGEAA